MAIPVGWLPTANVPSTLPLLLSLVTVLSPELATQTLLPPSMAMPTGPAPTVKVPWMEPAEVGAGLGVGVGVGVGLGEGVGVGVGVGEGEAVALADGVRMALVTLPVRTPNDLAPSVTVPTFAPL